MRILSGLHLLFPDPFVFLVVDNMPSSSSGDDESLHVRFDDDAKGSDETRELDGVLLHIYLYVLLSHVPHSLLFR